MSKVGDKAESNPRLPNSKDSIPEQYVRCMVQKPYK